jgi:hypothetical protein
MRPITGAIVLAGIVVAALPSRAATTVELLRCQKGLHSRASSFEKVAQLRLSACALKVESCQLAAEIDGDDPTSCLASAASACSAYSAKVAQYKLINREKATSMCGPLPLGDLERSVAGLGFAGVNASCGATSPADLVSCVFDALQCSVERTLFVVDPRAQNAFAAAGIAASHPCLGP